MNLDELRHQLFATVPEAAEVLRIDERTARRAIAAGQLPAVKISGVTRVPVAGLLKLAGLADDPAPSAEGEGGGLHVVA